MTPKVEHGNSGGPVFDEAGDLMGIVVARSTTDLNTNLAIKGEILRMYLDARGFSYEVDKSPKPLTPTQVASPERLRTAVFIECF
jgi:S1-C subfamily serine protease